MLKIHQHVKFTFRMRYICRPEGGGPRSQRRTYSIRNLPTSTRHPWRVTRNPQKKGIHFAHPRFSVDLKNKISTRYKLIAESKFAHKSNHGHTLVLIESEIEITRIRTHHTASAKGTVRLQSPFESYPFPVIDIGS